MTSKTVRMGMWALLAAGTVAGCQCEDELKTVAAEMELAPNPVAFGNVAVGSAAEQLVDVNNVGSASLDIESIVVTEGGDQISVQRLLATDCSGNARSGELMSIAPGGCARFAVRMVPKATGPVSGKIHIVSDDVVAPEFDLLVTGEGVVAALRACVLADDGTVVEADCTDFTQDPAVIPTIDFGELPLGDEKIRTVRLFNLGEGSLVVTNARVESDVPDLFVVGDAFSGEVPQDAPVDVDVAFAPAGSGDITGTLLLPSNDAAHPTVELPIVAKGLGAGLCFDPEIGLDFGAIPIGDSLTKTLKIENCGFVNYNLSQLVFTEDDPTSTEYVVKWVTIDGQDAAAPVLPLAFPPGSQLFAEVTYSPTKMHATSDAGDKAGFSIVTEFLRGRIPVIGRGASPGCDTGPAPTAVIQVFQGTQNITANPTVEPLRTVSLRGNTSIVPAGGASYVWRLVRQPQGGSESLTGVVAHTRNLFLQLAGEYEVELVVQDQYGCQSAPERIIVHVIPKSEVHIQLTWPQSHGDVDLHLVGPNGSIYNGQSDCYWANCKPGAGLDWGGGPNHTSSDGVSMNDPTLDIDALWGKGPENINVSELGDGVYKVFAHYYCSRQCRRTDWTGFYCEEMSSSYGAVEGRLNIFVNGSSVLTENRQLTQRDSWNGAVITVSNGGQDVTVTPGTSLSKISDGCTTDGN